MCRRRSWGIRPGYCLVTESEPWRCAPPWGINSSQQSGAGNDGLKAIPRRSQHATVNSPIAVGSASSQIILGEYPSMALNSSLHCVEAQ